MKLDCLKDKKELVATALLAVAVLSVVLIVVKVADFFVTSANAQTAVEKAIAQSKPDAKNVTTQTGKLKKVADALKKQNLFSPPPPPQNPVKSVAGIMGDEAIINGKLYKVGAKVGDAKIVAIAPKAVTIEWNGKKTVFNPIDGGSSSGPGGPSRSGRPSSSSSRGGQAGMVVTQGPMPGGGGMPDMAAMRARMANMSEADRDKARAQMRERFENMSEADRDRFRRQMAERMGGGRGGPGGSRGGGRGGPGGGRGGPGGGRGGR